MADRVISTTRSKDSEERNRRMSNRLRKHAPASLQISPSQWNAAIPLLSPLASSPTSPKLVERTVKIKSRDEARAEPEKKPVFKTWQHPAAPFGYDPAPLKPSFVPLYQIPWK